MDVCYFDSAFIPKDDVAAIGACFTVSSWGTEPDYICKLKGFFWPNQSWWLLQQWKDWQTWFWGVLFCVRPIWMKWVWDAGAWQLTSERKTSNRKGFAGAAFIKLSTCSISLSQCEILLCCPKFLHCAHIVKLYT